MITPIRGRKLDDLDADAKPDTPIRNDNPDKGTETSIATTAKILPNAEIRNDNPDKGTETLSATCLSTPSLD